MIRFFELAPSPNNLKVRMALKFKGVDFEATEVDFRDRAAVRAVSGQDLTPVIVDEGRGHAVLNDSEAIIQYLDANYPDAPRLVPRERAGRRAVEAFGRELEERVATPWLPVFMHGLGMLEELDREALGRFREGLAHFEKRLGGGSSFAEEADQAINDLRVAEWFAYARPSEGLLARVPFLAKIAPLYGIEAGEFPGLEKVSAPFIRLAE